MRFPIAAVTSRDKLEFLYIAQEKLRLEHNAKGEQFKNGQITEQAFRDYQKNVFDVRQAKISSRIAAFQTNVFEAASQSDSDQDRAGKRSRNMALKLSMKASNKFSVDLSKDLD